MTKPIFIIGFMGAGKTTLALDLAHKLNLPSLDSDFEIRTAEGLSIQEIFHTKGERYFRNLETHWITSLTKEARVISCGGGLPCFNDNLLTLKSMGKVIFLDTPIDIILQRIQTSQDRPLIQNKTEEEIKALYEKRAIYYRLADEIIK